MSVVIFEGTKMICARYCAFNLDRLVIFRRMRNENGDFFCEIGYHGLTLCVLNLDGWSVPALCTCNTLSTLEKGDI